MPRLAIIDRADMNAEQARVYDAAKQAGGPVGGPYTAYIRLPKLFEAAQNLRGCLAGGPLSKREQQIVNLVVARHWGARYPWFAQVRASLTARASTLRRRHLAEIESKAGRAEQSIGIAQVVLAIGFFVFMGFPAMYAVLDF